MSKTKPLASKKIKDEMIDVNDMLVSGNNKIEKHILT